MSQEPRPNAEGVDFALVAYREEGDWQVEELDRRHGRRPRRARRASCAATPATAARSAWCRSTRTSSCWSGCSAPTSGCCSPTSPRPPTGRSPASVVEHLELPLPDDEEDQEPAGDLGIVADLGMPADGHGRAARRPRPLPRRDARRHRRQARLRRQYDELVGVSRACDGVRPRWDAARCAQALDEARAALGHVRRTRRGGGARRRRRRRRHAAATVARPTPTRPRTPRSSRCAQAAAARGEWRLDGCTLVVTLEPCTMCAGAVVLSRVDRLVFGAYDDKAGAVGSLWDVVRDRRLNHRPEVRRRRARRGVRRALLRGVLRRPAQLTLDGRFRSDARVRYPRPRWRVRAA